MYLRMLRVILVGLVLLTVVLGGNGLAVPVNDPREHPAWCTNPADCVMPFLSDRPVSYFAYPEGEDPMFFRRDNYLPRGYLFYPADEPAPEFAVEYQNPNPSPEPGSLEDWDVRYFRVRVAGCRRHSAFNDLMQCQFWMYTTLEPQPDLEQGIGRVADLDPRRCNRFRIYRGTWNWDPNLGELGQMAFTPTQLEAETVIQLHPEFIVARVVVHRFFYNPPEGGAPYAINEYLRSEKDMKNLFDKTDLTQNSLDSIAQLYLSDPDPAVWDWNPALAARPMDSIYRQCGIGLRLVDYRVHYVSDSSLVFNVDGKDSVGGCGSVWPQYRSLGFEDGIQAFHIYFIYNFNATSSTSIGQMCMGHLQMAIKNHPSIDSGNVIAHELGHAVAYFDDIPGSNGQLMDQSAGTNIPLGRCCYARSSTWSMLFDADSPQLSNVARMSLDDRAICSSLASETDRPWTGLHPVSNPHPDSVDNDNDGVPNHCDNCPGDANPGQEMCQGTTFGAEVGMACDSDPDDDCLDGSEDNCPDVTNASQADCNDNGLGDACDPEPCAYLPTHRFMRRCGNDPGAGGVRWCEDTGELDVLYRLTGYEEGSPTNRRVAPLDARYCACQDENGNPLDSNHCKQYTCPENGQASDDRETDKGWLRLNWRARQEVGGTDSIECTLADTDGNTTANECEEPIPERVYRRLYYNDSINHTGLGGAPADFEAYWRGDFRTKHLYWRWEAEDWPHPMDTEWTWPPGYHRARGRVWLHPGVDPQELPITEGNAYTEPINFTKKRFYPEPYMGNEHLEIGQIIRFGPMGREAEAPALVLLGLSRTRSTEDLGDYAYERSRPSAALAGMQVLEYDPVGGHFDDATPSQATGGGVPLDVVDHALCTVAVPGILRSAGRSVYVFGGRDWDGLPVDTLWRGLAVGPDGVFGWEEVDLGPERPRPRQGAGLFWSAAHGLLLLVGGQGPETSDATFVPILIEPDRRTVDATTLNGDPLGNRAHFGYTQSGDVGLVYGGQDATGQPLDGLYAINLDRLHVSLLDWPSETGPGPRVGAALELSVVRKTVLLFGGEDAAGELHNDLWELDPWTGQWDQVRADCTEETCPPLMKHASIISSPMDGTLRVVTGIHRRSRNEDVVWSLGETGWMSYREATGECEGAACWQTPGVDAGVTDDGTSTGGGGCAGCTHAGGGGGVGGWLLVVLLALALVRRRRWCKGKGR